MELIDFFPGEIYIEALWDSITSWWPYMALIKREGAIRVIDHTALPLPIWDQILGLRIGGAHGDVKLWGVSGIEVDFYVAWNQANSPNSAITVMPVQHGPAATRVRFCFNGFAKKRRPLQWTT